MPTKWMVVHAHYNKEEPPERSDFEASFDAKDKVYRCPKCKKAVAGIERSRRNRLYILRKDVVVNVGE